MPIIQKQNAPLQSKFLLPHPEGCIIPSQYYKIDGDGHLCMPGPVGATIIKAGSFSLLSEGGALIKNKYLNTATPGIAIVSGEILLIDPNGSLMVPNKLVPSARTIIARERGHHRNLLIKAHGGVGDVVCAEPAIRFAVERFSDQEISLCTDYPEFFQHLKFKDVFPATGPNTPNYDNYLLFQNFTQGDELAWEFVAHPLTHAVDYASLNMWRCTLPNHLKEITLKPTDNQRSSMLSRFPLDFFNLGPLVVVHPGKTWDSRTFPKHWWDKVLSSLVNSGIVPIIIGGEVDKNPDGTYRASTVKVNAEGCLDLRGKLSFIETAALLQETAVLLTNDSSPLHIAASGNAWIGFCSTVKDPSHLMHWRKGEFGYKMKNFTDSNLFATMNFCPNQDKAVHVDNLHVNELMKWLPTPEEFAGWAVGKCRPYEIK